MELKVHYDPEQDILYLAQAGWEEEFVEIHPGVNLELDGKGEPIGGGNYAGGPTAQTGDGILAGKVRGPSRLTGPPGGYPCL